MLNRFKQAIRTDFPPYLRIEDGVLCGVRRVTVFPVLPILGVDLVLVLEVLVPRRSRSSHIGHHPLPLIRRPITLPSHPRVRTHTVEL